MNVSNQQLSILSLVDSYLETLKKIDENQFLFKKSDEIWSLCQLYEHIFDSNTKFFLRNCRKCLNEIDGQLGGDISSFGKSVIDNNSFPDIKIKYPEVFGELKLELKSMEFYRTYFSELVDEINTLSGSVMKSNPNYKRLHPAYFGFLNAEEWLQLAQIHMKHHLKQKLELESYL